MSYSVLPLFSKVFYSNKLDDLSIESLAVIKQFLVKQSYLVSKMSNNNNFADVTVEHNLLETKPLEFLKHRILDEFRIFKNEVLKVDNLEFDITSSWGTRSKHGKESRMHHHANCYYSGILYINVNPNSGDVVFKNLNTRNYVFDEKTTEWNIFNSRIHRWSPENKQILFFPAEVYPARETKFFSSKSSSVFF